MKNHRLVTEIQSVGYTNKLTFFELPFEMCDCVGLYPKISRESEFFSKLCQRIPIGIRWNYNAPQPVSGEVNFGPGFGRSDENKIDKMFLSDLRWCLRREWENSRGARELAMVPDD